MRDEAGLKNLRQFFRIARFPNPEGRRTGPRANHEHWVDHDPIATAAWHNLILVIKIQ